MQVQFTAQAEALKLQTKEIERRLEHLNGEQARIQSRDSYFLPREIFDQHRDANNKFQADIAETMATNKGQSHGMRELWGWIIAAVAILVPVLTNLFKAVN
jgi:ABC-type transporter lipoprotein component MlaA